MDSALRSILVIHPGGLGDVLLAVPALQAIRSHYPKRQLALLAGTEVSRLLHVCGIVDQIFSIEAGHLATLFAGSQQLSIPVEEVIRRCDLAIGWLNDSDGSLQATLRDVGVRRVILHAPRSGVVRHHSERLLASLQEIIGEHRDGSVRLVLPQSSRQAGLNELRKTGFEETASYVVCHPGSGSPHKCIKPEVFLDILTGCRDRALTPVIVGGPADEQMLQLLEARGMDNVPILRPQSLTILAGILAQASAYIGHDSGVTHLSALLSVPTVAIFGPTDPQQWAPQGPHVSVVTGAKCSCIGWETVRACMEKACLQVSATEVFRKLDHLLSRYHQVTKS